MLCFKLHVACYMLHVAGSVYLKRGGLDCQIYLTENIVLKFLCLEV